MSLRVHVVPTSAPDDVSAFPDLSDGSRVVAVLGKSEGNGCVNDFSRGLASRAWRDRLGSDVVTVMSGGTEGVLSPHVTLLVDEAEQGDAARQGSLGVGVSTTETVPPVDLGRRGQVEQVAAAVRIACERGGFTPGEASMVVAKCPLLTPMQIEEILRDGATPAAFDSYGSMGASRAATALGIGLASGELSAKEVDQGIGGDLGVYSRLASTSSGVEISVVEVVAIGPSALASGGLHAETTTMRDAIDAESVIALLDRVRSQSGHVVQLFAKCEPDPSGRIRGRRHTMLSDSDINATRHARAAVGGLLAGLVGRPDVYVSGGAEHQGPAGGGTLTVIWSQTAPNG
jgi:cyanuric acid amidohydrolase